MTVLLPALHNETYQWNFIHEEASAWNYNAVNKVCLQGLWGGTSVDEMWPLTAIQVSELVSLKYVLFLNWLHLSKKTKCRYSITVSYHDAVVFTSYSHNPFLKTH
jgi:hypothetical protein